MSNKAKKSSNTKTVLNKIDDAEKPEPNAKEFITPIKTIPIINKTKKDWLCEGTPCEIINQNETETTIRAFNKSRNFTLSNDLIKTNFKHLESDTAFVYTPVYPNGKIPLEEFKIKPISIAKLTKKFKDNKNFANVLKKADQDAHKAKGNNFCITMDGYNNYNKNPNPSKLERVGDPICNRNTRHAPPIPSSFTRKEFEESPSFPAPLGIRMEDFALPSEQNEIKKELLAQIFNCVNAPECPDKIKEELELTITPNSHMCNWCGVLMDISELNQVYCSKEHSINFCHRDPVIGTKKGNVYIGHCSCNREQGGYSEQQRVEQIIRLAKSNSIYREIIMSSLK